jgi:hypothetical protein
MTGDKLNPRKGEKEGEETEDLPCYGRESERRGDAARERDGWR